MPTDSQLPPMQDATWLRRHHRQNALTWGVLSTVLAFMLIVSFVVSPEDIDSGKVWLTPTCPSKRFFNVECPTCGMTRAFSALSRGHFRDAMAYNRGSPLFYLLTWVGVVWGAFNGIMSLREARRVERRSTGS